MLVYQIKNLINKKCYIGQTIHNGKKRKREHLRASKNSSQNHLYRAIRKYGKENFEWLILEKNISHINKLNWLEEFYIAHLNTVSPDGYNLTTGGKNCFVSDEVRQKISEAQRGKRFSKERRDNLSKSLTGRKMPNRKRIKVSNETKIKISKSTMGVKKSEKHCKNISKGRIGHKTSNETRKKISETLKNRKFYEAKKRILTLYSGM